MTLQQKDESSIVRFSERPGVYIANADAIVLAADLRKLLGPDPSDSRKEAVRWFVELLERVK